MILVRLEVNINDQTAAALSRLAEAKGISLTEAVRRAVAIFEYVSDETSRGRVIHTSDEDGSNKTEVVMI